MKIGITGKGFIANHLYNYLKESGHKIHFFGHPENDLINPDQNRLAKFLNSEVIIHSAAINRGTDIEIISGSVVATFNLISALNKKKQKPKKIIFFSSSQVETDTLYGKSKYLSEVMLEDFSNKTNIPVTVFRVANVFGENGKPFYNSVVATFCYQIARGEKLIINPSPKKFRFVYVGDLVKIVGKEIAHSRKKFFLTNISSKEEIAIPELAEIISGFKDSSTGKKNNFQKKLYNTYLSYLNGK